ncbi:hypothetical protein MMAN_21420 [Mycobacterium mantenii]|uniref:Mce protein n=1 Tax=Mycobacterium mantenii TaxID=560555 RepID=A0A1X0FMC5_MYCNT|nr:hypothetical protein [Mycobacterium mantenii]MCV7246497.1 Mce protein [Mycobacterium mantenii]ORB02861.1 hypothetical protein BST30_19335 [Mycobacterium mantenii]BBY38008.1 hypothetical protein MMAN_21420 [Mycobacterium mantenii]
MAEYADAADRQLSESVQDDDVEHPGDRIDSRGGDAAEEQDDAADLTANGQAAAAENVDDIDCQDESNGPVTGKRQRSNVRLALAFGLVVLVALTALAGWLGYRGYRAHQATQQRELFLQVARQGALNLTTISYTEAETDVQRIMDSATGTFYDDFKKRSQPFIDLVKQTQSKSVGTISAAGLESVGGDQAQALVAVHVTTSNVGAAEQPPRAWRMRIDVQKVGNGAKVSNVEFIP